MTGAIQLTPKRRGDAASALSRRDEPLEVRPPAKIVPSERFAPRARCTVDLRAVATTATWIPPRARRLVVSMSTDDLALRDA